MRRGALPGNIFILERHAMAWVELQAACERLRDAEDSYNAVAERESSRGYVAALTRRHEARESWRAALARVETLK